MGTARCTASRKKRFSKPTRKAVGPRCANSAILSAVQAVFPELASRQEKFRHVLRHWSLFPVRFPYYMNTYGFHTIHARAPEGPPASRP